MKKVISFLFFCLSGLSVSAQQTVAPLAKYVILVSIDGLRPDFYMDADWPTPNLQFLKVHGVYAQGVRGIFPTVTYPSHTTIITGAYPAKHGIVDNEIFSADTGATSVWYREAKYIKVPTLWDAVKKAGLTSACISWPVSVGAPVTYNFPEDWVDDNNGTRKINAGVTPNGLYEEIEQHVTGKLQYKNMNMHYLTIDENLSRIAAYLIKTRKPNFTAIHIVCVDHAEHTQGRYGDIVKKAIASADHAVSNILEAVDEAGIKDSTAIIITGDHGFADVHSCIYPNVWLSKAGLMKKVNGKTEWKAWFSGGNYSGSTFLHLKDKSDKQTLEKVKSILKNLPPAMQKLFRVVEKTELEKAGANPDAFLALAAIQGVAIGTAMDGDDIRSAKGGTHGYFPDFKEIQTGFIASGTGINQGAVISIMGLEDIAPVIARLLGISFTAPDGMLLPGITQ